MLKIDPKDPRLGEYIPYLYRTTGSLVQYESAVNFLDLISSAIQRHFKYNEAKIVNVEHFEELLISETFNKYQIDAKESNFHVWYRISKYFLPTTIDKKIINESIELARLESFYGNVDISKYDWAKVSFTKYFNERIHTLEVLLHNLPSDNQWVEKLKNDVNRFFAISNISLIYDLNLNLLKPLEEPLIQNIIDNDLLPRIKAISQERANEFILSHHEMLTDKPTDEIFIGAFKTLEEFARLLTSDSKFEFKKEDLQKYYPGLHPTIVTTIEKLKAHRGDKGAHGRNAPGPEEIRYLFLAILNIALLLLDYKELQNNK